MRTDRDADTTSLAPHRHAAWLLALLATGAIALAAAACGGSPAASSNGASGTASCSQLLSAGLATQGQGNSSTAAVDYQQIISKCPGSQTAAYAFYDLGVVEQVNNSSCSAAETDYQSALAIKPDQPDALYNLAICVTTSNPNEAIDDYTSAIKYDGANNKSSAASYLTRGFIEIAQGETTKGHDDQQKAITLDPSLASRLGKSTTTTT